MGAAEPIVQPRDRHRCRWAEPASRATVLERANEDPPGWGWAWTHGRWARGRWADVACGPRPVWWHDRL